MTAKTILDKAIDFVFLLLARHSSSELYSALGEGSLRNQATPTGGLWGLGSYLLISHNGIS